MKTHDANSDPMLSSGAYGKMKALTSIDQKVVAYVHYAAMISTEYIMMAYLKHVVMVYILYLMHRMLQSLSISLNMIFPSPMVSEFTRA